MAISDDIQNINSAGIRGDYPVAGEDNDTQGFRDNFSLIKENTTYVTSALTALNDETAKTTSNNDFNGFTVQNANLQNVTSHGKEGTISGAVNIGLSFEENGYTQFYTTDLTNPTAATFIIEGLPDTSNDQVLTGTKRVLIKNNGSTDFTASVKKSSSEFSQDVGTFYLETTTDLTENAGVVEYVISAGEVGLLEITFVVSTSRTVFIRELAKYTEITPTLTNG